MSNYEELKELILHLEEKVDYVLKGVYQSLSNIPIKGKFDADESVTPNAPPSQWSDKLEYELGTTHDGRQYWRRQIGHTAKITTHLQMCDGEVSKSSTSSSKTSKRPFQNNRKNDKTIKRAKFEQ